MASEESTEASERLLTRREELLLRIDFRELATLIEQALPNAAREVALDLERRPAAFSPDHWTKSGPVRVRA